MRNLFVLVQILIDLCPIVPLIYLAIKLYRFDKALGQKKSIREKQLQFKRVGDYFPKRIKQELEADPKIIKRYADEVIHTYRKLFLAIILYMIFWLLYIVSIVVRVIWIFNNHYKLLEPQNYPYMIASVLMSFLMLYWFLLVPLSLYMLLVRATLRWIQAQLTLWIALQVLMLYQYILLRLFSQGLTKTISCLIKRWKRFLPLQKYIKDNVLYLILKNCTYISMVLVYAIFTARNQTDTPLAGAIGVLFLIDTFLIQEKEIQEKVMKNHLEVEEIKDEQ